MLVGLLLHFILVGLTNRLSSLWPSTTIHFHLTTDYFQQNKTSYVSHIHILDPREHFKTENPWNCLYQHRCLSHSPWVSQSKQWLCHFPPDSSWQGGRTCTRCLDVNKFLSGIPDRPLVSATLCPGSVSHSLPFWTRQQGSIIRKKYPAKGAMSLSIWF